MNGRLHDQMKLNFSKALLALLRSLWSYDYMSCLCPPPRSSLFGGNYYSNLILRFKDT